MVKRKTTSKELNRSAEPMVIFILAVITVVEFLIYGAGVANGKYIESLNAMISLLNFGALLIIITLLLKFYNKFD